MIIVMPTPARGARSNTVRTPFGNCKVMAADHEQTVFTVAIERVEKFLIKAEKEARNAES